MIKSNLYILGRNKIQPSFDSYYSCISRYYSTLRQLCYSYGEEIIGNYIMIIKMEKVEWDDK